MRNRKKKVKVVIKTNFKRKMTEEDKKRFDEMVEKEQTRYRQSDLRGGIDLRGNYTALHHRWVKNYGD